VQSENKRHAYQTLDHDELATGQRMQQYSASRAYPMPGVGKKVVAKAMPHSMAMSMASNLMTKRKTAQKSSRKANNSQKPTSHFGYHQNEFIF